MMFNKVIDIIIASKRDVKEKGIDFTETKAKLWNCNM